MDGPVERARISGGRRLWLFFTMLLVGETFVARGGASRLLDVIWSPQMRISDSWFLSNVVEWTGGLLFAMSFLTLFGGGGLATLALVFRQARGAVAGSARDPVIRVRDFIRGHARFAATMPWLPMVLMTPLFLQLAFTSRFAHSHEWQVTHHYGGPLAFALAGALNMLMNRFALRSLDSIEDRAAETHTAVDRDETSFQAVAVTARTQGAVIGMFALTVAMVYGVGQSGPFWMRDFAGGLPMLGYALATLGFAAWFRKASTIAVGRDGIFVRGTSKERFFSYQDFDEVRLAGMHFDFHRAGKRVLRLQLHGTDDARAEGLAERIRGALALSKRTDGAHLLARAAVGGSLGRAAQGATDYRQPSVSREQLWELVEGEATDERARVAAAEALASAGGRDDRERLRVAAAHVADPKVRVALEDLADEDDPSSAAVVAAPLARV